MRLDLSKKYVSGTGLEIAAFHNPWPVFGAQVIYLDCLTQPELRKQFPEMNHKSIVTVHVIDNAQYLKSIPDESMDFVLSSHVFEHMENVGVALQNWLRVLKPGKHLVMAIPLKHNYIDKDRKATTTEHVIREFWHPETYDLKAHYLEYFSDSVDQVRGEALEHAVKNAVEKRSNVHFHCWDMKGIVELFNSDELKDGLSYEICKLGEVGHEVFVVLKKL